MFNSRIRREAIKKLRQATEKHEVTRKQVENASVALFELRQNAASEVIQRVESYVNTLANSPKEFDTTVAEFRVEADRFQGTVKRLETQASKILQDRECHRYGWIGRRRWSCYIGAVRGHGGGNDIRDRIYRHRHIRLIRRGSDQRRSCVAGRGGALAAGGGGMAAGNALLALAGPVGWGVGGAVLVGSGLYLNNP